MGAKNLRREAALVCPVHTAVREECAKRLEHAGAFSKAEVLDALVLEAMGDSIRWDYIREFLEEGEGCELIPVVALLFESDRTRARKNSPLDVKPEKYLAVGYGKKTAGFASVKRDEHANLVLARLSQRRNLANGVGQAFTAFVHQLRLSASPPVRLALRKSALAHKP